jgi:hypothetical protein
MWQLRQAFSRQEKTSKLLENLEKLRAEGTVDEGTYNRLKDEYQRSLEASKADIERIKGQLTTNVGKREEQLGKLNEELKILQGRFKVGELKEAEYERRRQRTSASIARTEREIAQLKNLISSTSSADVGGYADVDIKPTGGVSLPKLPELGFGGFPALESVLTPLRIAGAIAGLLMLIFVFLPWVSVEYLGSSFDFKALETISAQEDKVREFNVAGIFALLAGILAMVASVVLARPSMRGLGYLGAGILGIAGIGVFCGIFASSYQNVLDQMENDFGSLSYAPEVGGIVYLVAALAMLVIGYLELRQARR